MLLLCRLLECGLQPRVPWWRVKSLAAGLEHAIKRPASARASTVTRQLTAPLNAQEAPVTSVQATARAQQPTLLVSASPVTLD